MAKQKDPRFKRQFRKTNTKKNSGHPAYIYAKVGDEYKFLGITHAEITQGVKNIRLEKNPDPKDTKQAYIKPKADKAKKSTFGKRLPWKLNNKDKPTVQKIIDDNEKKPRK